MKKLISLLIALCMLLMMVPATAETAVENVEKVEEKTEASDGSLTELLKALLADTKTEGQDLSGLLQALIAKAEEEGIDLSTLLQNLLSSEEVKLDEEQLNKLLSFLFGGQSEGEGAASGKFSEWLGMLSGLMGSEGSTSENGGSDVLSSLLGSLLGGSAEEADSSGLVKNSEGTEEALDLSMLLGLLGGGSDFIKADDDASQSVQEIGETKESDDLSALLALLAGEGSESELPETVAAESVEQFFGAWKLTGCALNNKLVELENLTVIGMELPPQNLVISEGKLTYEADDGKEITSPVKMELVDGRLSVTENSEVTAISLTKDGGLIVSHSIISLIFAPAVTNE